ncbi:Endo-alpha-N-acetylgalactosaminidase [Trichinella pseudospiralis]
MWRYLYVVREGFGRGNWSLVDSGDCSRFKLVWVNASGRPKNSRLKRRKTFRSVVILIIGSDVQLRRFSASAARLI